MYVNHCSVEEVLCCVKGLIFMEDEFERIKSILEMHETAEAKIAFLLRQVEWLTQVNKSYKQQITKDKHSL